jgi:hypothetical protein
MTWKNTQQNIQLLIAEFVDQQKTIVTDQVVIVYSVAIGTW